MSRSRPAPALLLSALLFLLQGGNVHACSNVTSLSLALDTVLAEYDREGAPAHPVLVATTFDLRHAALRNDATVHVLGDLTLSWLDTRISWNASEWNCDSVMASADRLWLPDVTLLNGAGGGDTAALTARLASDGRVSWVLRYDATVPVRVDLADWPGDQQRVVIKFGSRSHTTDEITLRVNAIEHVVLFESGAWELVSVAGALQAATRAQQLAAYTVRMRRRAAAHAAAAGGALAAALLLLLAAAALPPPQRPPLCACASLTATLWLVSAALRLPAAASVPRWLALLGALGAAGGAAGAGAALVSRLARCSSRPPQALKALASSLSTFCRLAPLEDTAASASAGAWAALAALLDYAMLAVLLLTLFVVFCISL